MSLARVCFIWIIVTFFLVSCGQESASEHFQRAKEHVAVKQYNAAVIELKNAVSKDSSNANYRLELGQVYLKQGKLIEAQKELSIALESGIQTPELINSLLRTDYLLQNYSSISGYSKYATDPNLSVMFEFYNALASLALNTPDKVQDTIETAKKKLNSESTEYKVLTSYQLATDNDVDNALLIIDSVLQSEADNIEALYLAASIASANKDYELAAQYLYSATELLPFEYRTKLMLANAYLRANNYSEAELYADKVLKVFPNVPLAQQIKGISVYLADDFKLAKQYLENAIQAGIKSSSTMLLAGLANYKLENFEQAYNYLEPLKPSLNKNHPILSVITLIELKLGYTDQLADSISDSALEDKDSLRLYEQASYLMLQRGEVENAKRVVNKLDSIELSDSKDLKTRGLLKLSVQDISGILDIESSIQKNFDDEQAKLALAAAYLETNNYDSLIELGKQWQNEVKDETKALNLIALGYSKKGKRELAEEYFNKTLEISPNDVTALMYFSRKLIAEKKYSESKRLLNQILDASPNYYPSLNLLLEIERAEGNINNSINRISTFYKSVKNRASTLLMAKLHYYSKNFNKVAEILSAVDNKEAMPSSYWKLLTNSYIKLNNKTASEETLNEWAAGGSLESWIFYINYLEQNSNFSKMLSVTNRALLAHPDSKVLVLSKISSLVYLKEYATAENDLNRLGNQVGGLTNYLEHIKGRLLLGKKKFKEALPKLIVGYSELKSTNNAMFVFINYLGLKEQTKAVEFLKSHFEIAPSDLKVILTLAQFQIKNSPKQAIATYQKALEYHPENLLILNNLASLLYKQGKAEKAEKHIDLVLTKDRTKVEFLNTAIAIKTAMNKREEANSLFEEAIKLAPNNRRLLELKTKL